MSKKIMGKIGPSHNPKFLLLSADLCYQFDRALRDQIPWDREEEGGENDEKARKERERNEKKKAHLR